MARAEGVEGEMRTHPGSQLCPALGPTLLTFQPAAGALPLEQATPAPQPLIFTSELPPSSGRLHLGVLELEGCLQIPTTPQVNQHHKAELLLPPRAGKELPPAALSGSCLRSPPRQKVTAQNSHSSSALISGSICSIEWLSS